jgi:hypothetical protein
MKTKKRAVKKRATKKRATKKRATKRPKSIFKLASENKSYKSAKKRLEKLKKQVATAYKKAIKTAKRKLK